MVIGFLLNILLNDAAEASLLLSLSETEKFLGNTTPFTPFYSSLLRLPPSIPLAKAFSQTQPLKIIELGRDNSQ